MAQMEDGTLVSLVSSAEKDAVIFSGEFNLESEKALKYYLGLPFGDEEEGRSQLVSTDVQDVVEADMPSLVRTFLGSSQVMKFEARSEEPEEVKEAEDKTKYINWLIRHQPDSFATLHGWMKDAEIQKISVIKYFMEDTVKTTEEKFTGISDFELVAIEESLEGEDVEKVDIVETTEPGEDGTFDITFRVTKGRQKLQIAGVALENFRVSRFSTSLEDAELVGDDEVLTRGELLSQGFDKDLISTLGRISIDRRLNPQSNLKSIRFGEENGRADIDDGSIIVDWASEEVLIQNRYVKVDFDGDGIPERRYIRKSDQTLLVNEPYDHVPYAALSAILMPHKLIGRSRAELVIPTQEAKSAMLRGAADNTYMVNNPRVLANENVNIDELNDVVLNGVIQVKGDAIPANSIQPLIVPFVADKALLMLNYLDQQRSNRTGALATSQGLNADDIAKETATRFAGVESTGKEKVELVARVFAETGWRKLFEGVAWTVSRFQNTEIETMILGAPLTVNPDNWKFSHHVVSEVGLAISDNEESVQSLTGIMQDQNLLKASGSNLVDEKKMFNVRERLIKATGLGQVSTFYNDPEVADEILLAENEVLKQAVEQLQLQVQTNPLAEAETIKAQKDLLVAQDKSEQNIAKMLENQRQFNIKTQQEQQKINLEVQTSVADELKKQSETLLNLVNALGLNGLVGPGTTSAAINQSRIVLGSQQAQEKGQPSEIEVNETNVTQSDEGPS